MREKVPPFVFPPSRGEKERGDGLDLTLVIADHDPQSI